jgi:SH3-like domain-containing protein
LKQKSDLAPVHTGPSATSPVSAELEAGVTGTVESCNGTWCHLAGKNFDGWVAQDSLWGVYPNEKID